MIINKYTLLLRIIQEGGHSDDRAQRGVRIIFFLNKSLQYFLLSLWELDLWVVY